MNSKYKVLKFSSEIFRDTEDLISIEEPLEISLKYKLENKWNKQNLSITMRTPGHDKDLVRGFLFNEQIITSLNDIKAIESYGDKVGQYNIQNKILATLTNAGKYKHYKNKKRLFNKFIMWCMWKVIS
jgi:FdhD protein